MELLAKPLAGLVGVWRGAPEFEAVVDGFGAGDRHQLVTGLAGSPKAFFAAALAGRLAVPALYLVPDPETAGGVAADLAAWLGPEAVLPFEPLEVLPFEILAQSPEVAGGRLRALVRLAMGGPPVVVVAAAGALLRRLPPPDAFLASCVRLGVGDASDPDDLAERLAAAGYEPEAMVDRPGQFSRRGGIVDVFPLTEPDPVRVEFGADQVASIRSFSVVTQRSLSAFRAVVLPPASEYAVPPAARTEGRRRIARDLEVAVRRLEPTRPEAAARLKERAGAAQEAMAAGGLPPAAYLPYFYPDGGATLFDYLPDGGLVVLDESLRFVEAAQGATRRGQERFAHLLETGQALPGQVRAYASADEVVREVSRRRLRSVQLSALLRGLPQLPPQRVTSVRTRPAPVYHGRFDSFLSDLDGWRRLGFRVAVAAPTADRAGRLRDALADGGVFPVSRLDPAEGFIPGQVAVLEGELSAGFVLDDLRLAVLTDQEIYGRPRRRARARAFKEGVRLASLRELRPGDYVVHVLHGIGRYEGIRTLEVDGQHADYLAIAYAGEDRLYVPTSQMDKVQRYVGAEGQTPRVSRLGGADWTRTRQKVKESVTELARELLRLYAVRETREGHAFPADTPWQQDFEAAFRYEETPDQLRAIAEIKADMERPRPMDRLLCGDVGYGKTEVAMRAAFKAVTDAKQVAVLVPTTVLAQQHYHTFRERFSGYPVRIEVLSRFSSPREQAATIRGLTRGTVDIVIGTHRLLSADVQFRDLGLLIVDEEHRFGVAHKERLKALKETVDCLVLTATPIPRTLHMALAGIRDMSVIETPPEDRFPVQTVVVEYHDELVRDAIHRELDRGGQVFYVHNRVRTIEAAARRVMRLVPSARVAIAHGQMDEDALERVMLDFVEGGFDVLVCTTIIESGLDIPNVNTLIVEDADQLGLAQLYQLRGRVGRSNRLASAYFTYRRERLLSEPAEKRLEALRDFTELGAGFFIAMRDLEIRGAGNLLGPEQHGHIAAVGFELYSQLLEEAVRAVKGEPAPREAPPAIELRVDAYLPDGYVRDPQQKIEIYQRLVGVSTPAEVAELAAELGDRFGAPPPPVRRLLAVARIRALAAAVGVTGIGQRGRMVELQFNETALRRPERFVQFVQGYAGRAWVSGDPNPALRLRVPELAEDELLRVVADLLGAWQRSQEEPEPAAGRALVAANKPGRPVIY